MTTSQSVQDENKLKREQQKYVNWYFNELKKRVIEKATEDISNEPKPEDLLDMDRKLHDAINSLASDTGITPKKGFGTKFIEHVRPVTIIAAILALVFGIIGGTQGPESQLGPGFIDIAKIFAGAIVGSAAATQASVRSVR